MNVEDPAIVQAARVDWSVMLNTGDVREKRRSAVGANEGSVATKKLVAPPMDKQRPMSCFRLTGFAAGIQE